ncbi:hypothetical protein [Blastococcus sp. CT_GayMR16]|uniref:hypothetical protein n=1 Tax=Blastococcus sp. CT_GayMR16 TaxID=2559607 RepID=UPI001074832F|nr:hypothetical protein [Blastococcus sp. CT_GayMR16]TFV86308.1 hypothetical protein E4P38_17545 [Blastococcus sp. CT_GayMR16]
MAIVIGGVLVIPAVVSTRLAERLMLWLLTSRPFSKSGRLVQASLSALTWACAGLLLVSGPAFLGAIQAYAYSGLAPTVWWRTLGAGVGLALAAAHATFTVRRGRHGSALLDSADWAATHGERQQLARMLTRQAPLRSYDQLWFFLAVLPAAVALFQQLWESRPGMQEPTPLPYIELGFSLVALVGVGAAWLQQQISPEIALADLAIAESRRHRLPHTAGVPGRRAASLLRLASRRRSRRLPVSVRAEYVINCARLGECLLIAHLQQATRPQAAQTLRSLVQQSARIAACPDPYAGVERLRGWLQMRGLGEVPATAGRTGRLDPVVRTMEDLAAVVRNVVYVVVVIVSLVVLVMSGLTLESFVERFR